MTTSLILAFAIGMFAWTLAEYGMHRVLGHNAATRPNPFATEHIRHHAEGDYFAPTWKKAGAAVVILPFVTALVALGFGLDVGVPLGLGFVTMFVAYEVVHRRAHTHAGMGAYGRFLRRHHFHHHFGNPACNHGVTSPLWDVVFGTYEPVTHIRVPAKLRMQWLVDPATGAVHDALADVYSLR